MGKEGEGEDKSREAGEPPRACCGFLGGFLGDFVQDGGRGVRSVQELPIGVATSVI